MGSECTSERSSVTEWAPPAADYARVLELINEFLPAYEFAGRIVTVSVLREFGLLDDQRLDNVLATVFLKSRRVEVPT